MIRPLDLMEPEETVGNLWHDWASRRDVGGHAGEGVGFEAMRPSVAMLFRALGGPPATEIVPAPAAASGHRRSLELGCGGRWCMSPTSAASGCACRR